MTESQSVVLGGVAASRRLPQMRVAGGLLGIIGAVISTGGAVGAALSGLLTLFYRAFTEASDSWSLVFSPLALRIGLQILFGGFLVFLGRMLAGRSRRRAIVDGMVVAFLPLTLAILAVLVVLVLLQL